MNDFEKMLDGHANYVDVLKQLPLELALSSVSTVIDELAKIHNIDTMEMWHTMITIAHIVYLEHGGVDYDV